jgi:MFS family permease
MLLSYATQPMEFGSFLSLVTIFSIVATFLTARLSDKQKHRRTFIIGAVAAFAIAAIFTSQLGGLAWFFIGYGLVSFFSVIFLPLPFALVADNSKSLVDSMLGREFMLGVGRVAGVLVGFLILLYSNLETVLLFQGLALLLYIPLFENRKKKLSRL